MKNYYHFQKFVFFSFLMILAISCNQNEKSFKIYNKAQSTQSNFAIKDLVDELDMQGYIEQRDEKDIEYSIVVGIDTLIGSQGYEIRKKRGEIVVNGGDNIGVMYALFDLTEQLSLTGNLSKVNNTSQQPFIEKRGIKFNIPLDARLPSYDDTGDAAQHNILEMWDIEFWYDYLDQLARNRYNVLSLWTKHPFPGMIKMDDYPEVAMDDVYIYNKEITPKTGKDWNGIDIQDKSNLKLIKKISIEEKIKFWQEVMKYAYDRGIEIYLFTWNAFVTGAEQYGISTDDESAVSYIRSCVKEFALTYPYLAGVGVTAGEKMSNYMAGRSKVEWIYDTYGKGLEDAASKTDGREIRFIFRMHATSLEDIKRDFAAKYKFETETSFKYSAARMYSNPSPILYRESSYKDVSEVGMKCWMNIRNDDIFCFRWGDPDYTREFIKNMEPYDIGGFYIGPDGYVFGREFISKNSELSGELEIKKHWYREMLWGRLSYNPELKNEFFEKKIGQYFPESDSKMLFSAWQNSSKVIPLFQKFLFKTNDAQWHIEGCIDEDGFQNIIDIIDCPTSDSSKYMDIMSYCNAKIGNIIIEKTTPIDIALQLHEIFKITTEQVKSLKKSTTLNSPAYNETIADIEAMIWLGEYYAHKTEAAIAYTFYEYDDDKSMKSTHRDNALKSLEKAKEAWIELVENVDSRYKSQLLARTTYLDWKATIDDLDEDRAIVEKSKGVPTPRAVTFTSGVKSRDVSNLVDFLSGNGYETVDYPTYQYLIHPLFTVRVIAVKSDSRTGRINFKNEGGVEPKKELDENGYAIVKLGNTYWIFGNDSSYLSKGINEFLERGLF